MRFRFFAVLFVLPLFASAQSDFSKAVYPPGKGRPQLIVPGRFDGTASEQALLISGPGYDATILRRNGINNFSQQDIHLVDGISDYVISVDINNDGKTDIIHLDLVEASIGNKLVVRLSPSTVKTYDLPFVNGGWKAEVADLDLDSKLDIVLAGLQQPLYFFKGDGTGNFALSFLDDIMSTVTQPFALALRDVNGDQHLDFIIAYHGKASIYTRKFPSTVYTKIDITYKDYLVGWGVFDYSGDGRPDFVANTYDNNRTYKVIYFANDGAGAFSSPVTIKESNTNALYTTDHRDFDGDGKRDILLLNYRPFPFDASGTSSVLHNIGGGNFKEEVFQIRRNAYDLKFMDLDGTGPLEIVASANNNIDFYRTNGAEYFASESILLSVKLVSSAIYDLDKDGFKDIIGPGVYNNAVTIWYGKGTSEFEKPVFYPVAYPREDLKVEDFNGDGFGDLTFAGGDNFEGAWIMYSTGARTYAAPKLYGAATIVVLTADVDNDGDVDLATTSNVYKNDGLGNLTLSSFHSFQNYPSPAATGHFNGDQFIDIAVAYQNKFYFSFNDGTGAFLPMSEVPSAGKINFFKAVDFNGDHHTDILAVRFIDAGNYTEVVALTGNGNGGFSELILAQPTEVGASLGDVGDVNKDGLSDIVITHSLNSTKTYGVRVYHGKAGGGYSEPQFISTTGADGRGMDGATSVRLADLNKDSKLDIVVTSTGVYPLAVMLNDVAKPTSSIVIENVAAESKTATISFAAGHPVGKLVVLRKDPGTSAAPADGNLYQGSRQFGSGAKIGDGYVVMRAYNNSVTVQNLEPDTKYVIEAYAFETNEKSTVIKYGSTAAIKTFTTKKLHTITFGSIPEITIGAGNATVTATSSAGLPVTLFLVAGQGTFNPTTGVFTPAAPGAVSVTAMAPGNDVYSAAFADKVFCINPKKPTITVANPAPLKYILTSSPDSSYQWFVNDDPIVGAHGQTHEVKEDGVYTVAVVVYGCYTESDPTPLLITGLEDSGKSLLNVWPNPAESFIRISSSTAEPMLYNAVGSSFQPPYRFVDNEMEVNVESLPPGLYVLKLRDVALKVIKK